MSTEPSGLSQGRLNPAGIPLIQAEILFKHPGPPQSTLAFYELTKQNLTGPEPAHFGFQTAIGEARSRGIELDINARIDSHWNLIGTYSFTDAVLTKNYEGNEGNRLLPVPKNMGSL